VEVDRRNRPGPGQGSSCRRPAAAARAAGDRRPGCGPGAVGSVRPARARSTGRPAAGFGPSGLSRRGSVWRSGSYVQGASLNAGVSGQLGVVAPIIGVEGLLRLVAVVQRLRRPCEGDGGAPGWTDRTGGCPARGRADTGRGAAELGDVAAAEPGSGRRAADRAGRADGHRRGARRAGAGGRPGRG